LIFSCWAGDGARSWRIAGWEWTGEKLLLEASRRMGAERTVLELIPRAPASAIAATLSAERRQRCALLARLACRLLRNAKVERLGLSAGARKGQPGRYARILLRTDSERLALTGILPEDRKNETDAFLSSALIWFTRICEGTRSAHARKLWLAVQRQSLEPVRNRLALLREELQEAISLFEIEDEWQELKPATKRRLSELWEERPARLPRLIETAPGESARGIMELEPQTIDVVRARHGETLRFHGLTFARVRRLMNEEHVWFGIEGRRRRLLEESTLDEWAKLLAELKEYRRADGPDHHHLFYKSSSEAWLESLLRRDITQLDPGLRLAPLHAQFRTTQFARPASSRPVDLLALRRDGRLCVIELKVTEDRELVFQGADYWQRVEAARRRGQISGARLFGDARIEDAPPLVYLVAPLLRFHRAFQTLARTIHPDIEIYRFDINEDWRAGVRVVRRTRVN
jgi:hypothetical protein